MRALIPSGKEIFLNYDKYKLFILNKQENIYFFQINKKIV